MKLNCSTNKRLYLEPIARNWHDVVLTRGAQGDQCVYSLDNGHPFDRGREFAKYNDLDMDVYFCNPHSPWEKGSNENFNGRLRRYLPKRFDHRDLSQKLLDQIQLKMNNTPRKCLGFKTPIEALFDQTSTPKYLLDP